MSWHASARISVRRCPGSRPPSSAPRTFSRRAAGEPGAVTIGVLAPSRATSPGTARRSRAAVCARRRGPQARRARRHGRAHRAPGRVHDPPHALTRMGLRPGHPGLPRGRAAALHRQLTSPDRSPRGQPDLRVCRRRPRLPALSRLRPSRLMAPCVPGARRVVPPPLRQPARAPSP
jgi:hypothetical protein